MTVYCSWEATVEPVQQERRRSESAVSSRWARFRNARICASVIAVAEVESSPKRERVVVMRVAVSILPFSLVPRALYCEPEREASYLENVRVVGVHVL